MVAKDYAFAAVLGVVFAAFYTIIQPFEALLVPTTDILFVAVSGVCSILGLVVVFKVGYRGKLGLVHVGLFLAVFFWFLGETTWSIYEIYFRIPVPYPSVADVFYLAGYIPAALAVLWFLWVFRNMFTALRYTLTVLAGLVISGTAYALLLGPLLSSNTGFLEKAFDVAYPVLDVVLLVLAVMMALLFQRSSISLPWLWIAVGLLMTSLADIAFSLGTLENWYYSGHPIELFWLWGYLSYGLGFKIQWKAETEIAPA